MNLLDFYKQESELLEKKEQFRTAKAYTSAYRSLSKFLGREAEWKDFSPEKIEAYERSLINRELSSNTISFYMRMLRAIRNRAIKKKIIRPTAEDPFSEVFTGLAETRKRSLSNEDLEKLNDLANDKKCPPEYRDSLLLFIFCICVQGMSFVDVCFLKKSDIKDGLIIYRRRKTSREVRVVLTPEAIEIIDWFAERVLDSPYVFPIIVPGDEANKYKQYLSATARQNRLLKKAAKMAGVTNPFTHHAARHSYASLAHENGALVGDISEALGHREEKTTAIYLNCINPSRIGEINRKVTSIFNLKLGDLKNDCPQKSQKDQNWEKFWFFMLEFKKICNFAG